MSERFLRFKSVKTTLSSKVLFGARNDKDPDGLDVFLHNVLAGQETYSQDLDVGNAE